MLLWIENIEVVYDAIELFHSILHEKSWRDTAMGVVRDNKIG